MGRRLRILLGILVALKVSTAALSADAQAPPAAPAEVLPYPSTGFAPPTLLVPPTAPLAVPAPTRLPTPEQVLLAPPPDGPSETPPPDIATIATEPLAPSEVQAEIIATEPDAPAVSWYRPLTWFRPDPWDVGFELGINGSTGTSETTSLRTGGYIKRKTNRSKLDTSLYYNKTSADGEDQQSNALFKGRHDWLDEDSPWTLFASNQVFYDEFQAFDINVNVNLGVGYEVFDTEWVKLLTSFGSGASREFGGPTDRWVPEAQFGFDWEQKVSDTQRFYANVDYFPGWEDFSEYRVLTDVGLEVDLSQPSNVSLKLSATDRFDSTPDGVSPHNTNYSVLLLWKR